MQILKRLSLLLCAAGLLAAFPTAGAPIPPPEKLLPGDTLVVVTVPDWGQTMANYKKSSQSLFLNDPAMKPFCDKFMSSFKDEFLGPLQRDLGVKLDDYGSLAQGQLTLAIAQNGWDGQSDQVPSALFLLDTKDKSSQLKSDLATLRQKWVDSGKTVRSEKIRGVEFSVIVLSSNDVPKTLQEFFPRHQPIQELGQPATDKAPPKKEIYVGQYDSLLVVGDAAGEVDKVLARLTGGSVPALADEAAFEKDRLALFRDAQFYLWFNAKRFFDVLSSMPQAQPNPDAPSLFPQINLSKVLAVTGLSGLKTLAFCVHKADEGSLAEVFIGAPESSRQGLFRIFATEMKESKPPAFVPADVVAFQRWRIDGQQAEATLEKIVGAISPQAINLWNFFLSTGTEAEKDKDSQFDLRKDLIGNLGDDFISYSKAIHGGSPTAAPSIMLVGSPNPERMAGAVRSVLSMVPNYSDGSAREFLGRKIYTINSPSSSLVRGSNSAPSGLSFSTSGGYLALSADPSLLEEYLRSNEGEAKKLRELPGLADAAEQVGGQNTGHFGYENQQEKMRALFEKLRATANSDTNSPSSLGVLEGSIPLAHPEKSILGWMDFSLLPSFDKVSKYFYFTVSSGTATADGISFKVFSPTPPGLK